MELCAAERVKRGLKAYGVTPSKSLGQNFLTDDHVIEEICDGADIGEEDLVIEIGPGLGVLTARLAERAAAVVGVEIDRRMTEVLTDSFAFYENVKILNCDILKTSLAEIISREDTGGFGAVKVVGNLPYYITTPIILKVLKESGDSPSRIKSLTAMMQKEVAERIGASPSTKAYGTISLAAEYYSRVYEVTDVPRDAFIPSPNVDSRVLRMDIREKKPVELTDEEIFFTCIKAAFRQRRKTLRNCLTGLEGMDRETMERVLVSAGIDPGRRGETLDIREFAGLANKVAEVCR